MWTPEQYVLLQYHSCQYYTDPTSRTNLGIKQSSHSYLLPSDLMYPGILIASFATAMHWELICSCLSTISKSFSGASRRQFPFLQLWPAFLVPRGITLHFGVLILLLFESSLPHRSLCLCLPHPSHLPFCQSTIHKVFVNSDVCNYFQIIENVEQHWTQY